MINSTLPSQNASAGHQLANVITLINSYLIIIFAKPFCTGVHRSSVASSVTGDMYFKSYYKL